MPQARLLHFKLVSLVGTASSSIKNKTNGSLWNTMTEGAGFLLHYSLQWLSRCSPIELDWWAVNSQYHDHVYFNTSSSLTSDLVLW